MKKMNKQFKKQCGNFKVFPQSSKSTEFTDISEVVVNYNQSLAYPVA